MEIRSTRRETAKDRAFELSNVIEFSVNQSLSEIRRGLAIAWIRDLADCDGGQVTDVQPALIHRRIRAKVFNADADRCRKRMISHVRCGVTRCTITCKRRNTAGNKTSCGHVIVEAG